MTPTLIDLHHQAHERVIGSYLLDGDELALIDCGPPSTVATLVKALAEHGVDVGDVRHLLLTHIHIDHAGAAGNLVRLNPALQVHVSEIGAPHLVDPTRLELSARRLFGDDFDGLFGEMLPVPEEHIRMVSERVLGLDVFPSPGHAKHHVCFVDENGTCFVGDAAGVRIVPAHYVAPTALPPEVDLEAWNETIDELERRRPTRLCLTHYGIVDEPAHHLSKLREHLADWADRARELDDERQFVAAAEADLRLESDAESAESYRIAAPFRYSYAGLRRYWDKRAEA